jgi:hypothetical protein
MTEKPTITITLEEYNELLNDSIFLNCLVEVGVDNWEGFEAAQELMQQHEED